MILLAIYAIAVWVGVAWWRRRWPGALVLALSIVPVAAFTLLAGYIAAEPGAAERLGIAGTLTGYGGVIYTVSAFYTAMVVGIGVLIFVQPKRRLGHQCTSCGYDMRGSLAGICPECGTDHQDTPPARAAPPGHHPNHRWRHRDTGHLSAPSPRDCRAPLPLLYCTHASSRHRRRRLYRFPRVFGAA